MRRVRRPPAWTLRALFVSAVLVVTAPLALAQLRAHGAATVPPRRTPALVNNLGTRPLFSLRNMRPGVPFQRCIVLTGRNASASYVALYATGRQQPLDRYLDVTITRGHGHGRAKGSCAGFRADRRGNKFSGLLSRYPRTAGRALRDKLSLRPGATRVFRFTVTLADNSRAQGLRSNVKFVFRPGTPGRRIFPLAYTYSSFSATTSTQATFSAAKLFPPDNAAPPAVSGTVQVNQTLTAAPGTWSRNPSSFRYQWKRCAPAGGTCVVIGGATGSRYIPRGTDVGHVLLVSVAAVNGGGSSSTATSRPTAVVPPYAQTSPAPGGLPAVGQTLTASTSGWLGQGLSFAYQWVRCDETGSPCSTIPGATSPTYTLGSADRRSAIAVRETATLPGASAGATSAETGAIAASANPIVVENAQPGTTAWWVPPTQEAQTGNAIQAYTSETSVAPGDTLHVHLSTTPAALYRIEIFRLGWYGGAGGRLIACLPSCGGSEQGVQQAVPAPEPATGYLDAGWPVTDQIPVGSDWVSGYYAIKLDLLSGERTGQARTVPFIVRPSTSASTSPVLVQAASFTWQAYNAWGGKSLYDFNSSGGQQADLVSFNRPYTTDSQPPQEWELYLVRYLERLGVNASYYSDEDIAATPSLLLGRNLDIAAGHNEYWTHEMRTGWDAARDSGTNLLFAGADIGYWQARSQNAGRTLVEYRSARLDPETDPTLKTVAFQDLSPPLPPCELQGVGYSGAQAFGLHQPDYTVPPGAPSDPLMAGTGTAAGEDFPNLVGYEWDHIIPGCAVPGISTTLLSYPGAGGLPPADAVAVRTNAGGLIFSMGSLNVNWALDGWDGHNKIAPIQRLVGNVLAADGV